MNIKPNRADIKQKIAKDYRLLPFGVELSSDTLTPISAFINLKRGVEQAFLLESADGGESVGRYTFIGIDPLARLESEGDELKLRDFRDGSELRKPCSFKNIELLLESYSSPTIDGFPPFTGGAVGFVSYDSVRFLEEIPMPNKGTDAKDVNLLLFQNVIAFDRLKHRVFIITHLENSQDIEVLYADAEKKLKEIQNKLFADQQVPLLEIPSAETLDLDSIPLEAELGREKFCDAVRKVKQHIKAGDIFQCVLSDRFSFDLDVDPIIIYRILRMINPSPYLFYLDLGDGEVLLGSSPEMLLKSDGKTIGTCPIAGTRPRGKDHAEDLKFEKNLLASVKETAEHLMLVDLGRNDIGRMARPGTVEVTEFMKVERFSHVMHLVSLVEGKLKKGASSWDALGSCFPAGTLSGAPKIRAMEIISELEGGRRGPYGGAVVAHDFSGNLNSCITIRSLYVNNGKAYIQAGAGVVADSRPEKEYDEVLNKAKAVQAAVAHGIRIGKEQA